MKGPAIFLAQFAGTKPPFDKLETMAQWAAGLGYVGVQVPTDPALFDVEQAAKSQTYCDEIAGKLADADVVISELSTHLQDRLHADLLEVRSVQLRRLGRARVGMLLEASRGRCARRRAVHSFAHDPARAARIRRLRRELRRSESACAHSRPRRITKGIEP
jgi:hypothetical protein